MSLSCRMLKSPIGTVKQNTPSEKINRSIMSEVNMKKRNALQSVEKPSIDLGMVEMKSCVFPNVISEDPDLGNLVEVRHPQNLPRCSDSQICDSEERMFRCSYLPRV